MKKLHNVALKVQYARILNLMNLYLKQIGTSVSQ